MYNYFVFKKENCTNFKMKLDLAMNVQNNLKNYIFTLLITMK